MEETTMIANLGGAHWTRLRATFKEQLARLNDDGLEDFLGQLETLASTVQPKQGIPAEEVERQMRDWQHLLEGVDTGEAADVEDLVSQEPRGPHASSLAR